MSNCFLYFLAWPIPCIMHSTKHSCEVLKCEISMKFRIFTNLPELEIVCQSPSFFPRSRSFFLAGAGGEQPRVSTAPRLSSLRGISAPGLKIWHLIISPQGWSYSNNIDYSFSYFLSSFQFCFCYLILTGIKPEAEIVQCNFKNF